MIVMIQCHALVLLDPALRTSPWLGRLLTRWAPQSQLRSFEVRFAGITHLGHVLSCGATVADKQEQHGERLVRLQLSAVNQYGETKLAGGAVLALR